MNDTQTLEPRDHWFASLAAFLLIGVVVATTYYTHLPRFGLYEDDYWAIAPNLGRPLTELWDTLLHDFATWPHGRPLNHFLPVALASIGSAIADLSGVYLLGYLWLTLNCLLLWRVARRLLPARAAIIAALVYAVFPPDSTRILLVHAAHVQGSMTFLLLGTWLWLRGGAIRCAAYPIAALSLLSYETAFLPFLSLPLLAVQNRRLALRDWSIHVVLCTVLVFAIAWVRFETGDARVSGAAAEKLQTLYRCVSSLWIGPATSSLRMITASVEGWSSADITVVVVFLLIALASTGGWQLIRRQRAAADARAYAPNERRTGGSWPSWWVGTFGLVAWSSSYVLTITNYPPTQTVGRLTSTHLAAAFGASIAVASFIHLALKSRRAIAVPTAILSSMWFFGAFAYDNQLQREYAHAWRQQKNFWRQIVTLSPDIGPGWSGIASGSPPPPPAAILANSWADCLVFSQIFGGAPNFGHLGHTPPSTLSLRREGEELLWRPVFWAGEESKIDPARLALFEVDGDSVRRVKTLNTAIGSITATAPVPTEPRSRPFQATTAVTRLLLEDE